jgi:hypothetical protein
MGEKHCKERIGEKMRRIDVRKEWETEWEERMKGKYRMNVWEGKHK